MSLPSNPNGKPNSDVLKPYWNGDDIVGRPRDVWIVDFPSGAPEADVSLFEKPFEHISSAPCDPPNDMRLLKDSRAGARDDHARNNWWMAYWPRPEMREKISKLTRYLVTPMTAEHWVFYWLSYPNLPDNNLVVVTREDDLTFGLLSSRYHELWSTARGNRMGAGNQRRYNGTSIFETFPYPDKVVPNAEAGNATANPHGPAIASAAKRLNELREAWLNPPELTKRVREKGKGFPDRVIAKDEKAETELRKRTLTELYNLRPAWLANAHKALDDAVANAYGWANDLPDDGVLSRLLDLNLEQAAG